MSLKLKKLADQVLLITGASSGIGLVTAKKAAAHGATVFLVARNEAALQQACEQIARDGGKADYAVADVGDAGQVATAVAKAIAKFGRIDTWVNNAGVAIYARLENTPDDEHRRLFQTNYWGVVNGSLEAIRRMRQSGGALITVGSVASDMGSPILGAYAASKHAVKGYLDSLRIELLNEHVPISVTLIKPAGISTPLGQHLANHLDGEAMIPPPTYSPELVADAILRAAEIVTRDLIVGGAGAAQVMLATHAPGLFDRVAGGLIPQLSDPSVPKTTSNNLFGPTSGGDQTSPNASARPFSTYTSARLHPLLTLGAGIAVTALAVTLARAKTAR